MGKAKMGGVRWPFDWIAPGFLQQVQDTLGPLIPLFGDLTAANPTANFVIPTSGL